MMLRALGIALAAASASVMGCAAPENAEPENVASQSAPLTAEDVDVAPECQGIIDFANTASFATLDAYLPSHVALNIIGQRGVTPFVTLADLSAVNQVGEERLHEIHYGALNEYFIDTDCVGILDEVAVSAEDEQAMVDLVNTVTFTELYGYLPDAWNGAWNLHHSRPFTHASQLSEMWGIGPVSFRRLRNAATLARPFEELAAAVNALHRDADIFTHFDWYAIANDQSQYQLYGMTCFGIDPDLLPNGTDIRPELADDEEVYADVEDAVSFANRYSELSIDPAIGLANLEERIADKTFFGCYIGYANDPWSGNNLAFFVDTETGFGVRTETRWSE
jgi:hypothetical protein